MSEQLLGISNEEMPTGIWKKLKINWEQNMHFFIVVSLALKL